MGKAGRLLLTQLKSCWDFAAGPERVLPYRQVQRIDGAVAVEIARPMGHLRRVNGLRRVYRVGQRQQKFPRP